jgi:hypothetical protein
MIAEQFRMAFDGAAFFWRGTVLGKSTRRLRLEPMPALDLRRERIAVSHAPGRMWIRQPGLVEMSVDRTKRYLVKPCGQNAAVIP